MKTLFVIVVEAGTLELVADGDLEFRTMDIFKNEASPACDTHEIKFRDNNELMFDLFDFAEVILLFRLRHHTINIIR
jgi:hypothetical protein